MYKRKRKERMKMVVREPANIQDVLEPDVEVHELHE